LRERLLWPAWIGVGTVVLAVVLGARGLAPLLAFGLAGFGGGSAGRQIVLATRRQGWRGLVGRANGGMIVHLGVVTIAVAFAASASYIQQTEVKLAKGESAVVAGHTITYLGVADVMQPNRVVTLARVTIDGAGPYEPSLNRFAGGGSMIGTPSVRSTPVDDVMVTLLALPERADDPINLRIIVQPFVAWLWIGGAIMAIGTLFAAIPSRVWRRPTDPVSAPLADLSGDPDRGGTVESGASDEQDPRDGSGGTDDEPATDEPVAVP
jgi:cytochrome c-type biogenesis protein CcmF